jgi:hypothetical protein
VGIIPREYSSGGQQLGEITKQGSPLLRFLWGEAGAHAVRRDPELKRFYRRKLVQKGLGKARVARGTQAGDPAVDHGCICPRRQRKRMLITKFPASRTTAQNPVP